MRPILPLLLATLSCATVPGGGGGFPEALTRPLLGTVTRDKTWSWPKRHDFDAAWEKRIAAGDSHRMLLGTVSTAEPACTGQMLYLEKEHAGKRVLVPLLERDYERYCTARSWEVTADGPEGMQLLADETIGRLEVTQRVDSRRVPSSYLTDWTYAATLLAATTGNSAKLLADYEANVPVGGCSMDTAPQEFAREAAEACFQKGELACFLQLQIRIMGDQFNRVAWSSYGEAAHETGSKRLDSTGIDVDRFFRGLIVRVPGERAAEMQPSRLARALIESGRDQKFKAELERMAQDEALDGYNRYRATTTLASMLFRSNVPAEQVDAQLKKLKLDPMAQLWWSTVPLK